MSIVNDPAALKGYFSTGSHPTQGNFADVIDTLWNNDQVTLGVANNALQTAQDTHGAKVLLQAKYVTNSGWQTQHTVNATFNGTVVSFSAGTFSDAKYTAIVQSNWFVNVSGVLTQVIPYVSAVTQNSLTISWANQPIGVLAAPPNGTLLFLAVFY